MRSQTSHGTRDSQRPAHVNVAGADVSRSRRIDRLRVELKDGTLYQLEPILQVVWRTSTKEDGGGELQCMCGTCLIATAPAGAQVVAHKTLKHANCIAGREIVAGQKGRAGFEDGLPDVSQLNKPSAIFLSYDAKSVIICDDGNAAVFIKIIHARAYIYLYRCIHDRCLYRCIYI